MEQVFIGIDVANTLFPFSNAIDQEIQVEGEPPGQLAGSVWQVGRRKFARLEGVEH